MALAYTTHEVPSRRNPGTVHTLTLYNGKAVNCDCDERQAVGIEKYNFKSCQHMIQHNAAMQAITGEDLTAHVEDSIRSYEGCEFCGRNHKSWNCPF